MAKIGKLKEKRGFALILVFSLAAIILLLSLSLVSLTQVETASNRYDQGMRVARAHARLALDMAIGDLQEFTGPDQRITATADGARSGAYIDDNFNDATDPALNGVYQPFWTGVWNNDNSNDNPIWLVTRPLDANYTLDSGTQDADPFASDLGTSNPLVKLVGAQSAKPENPGTGQDEYDVYVPKELVASDEIVGMAASEESTVGHYAYWVGDNGVKASYLLEDNVPEVLHDIYETSSESNIATYENLRLRQMSAHRNFLEMESLTASPRLMDATDLRLSTIASEFAISEEINTGDSLLGSFTHNDVLRRYHDFSGLSKGLLVDTVRGGLKEDLSNIHEVDVGSTAADDLVDDLVNNYLMPYLNVEDIVPISATDLTRTYAISAGDSSVPTPTISPVITEFWQVVWLSAPNLGVPADGGVSRSNIYGNFSVVVELWNPYTSRIEGSDLRIEIENPDTSALSVHYYDTYVSIGTPTTTHTGLGLDALMNGVSEFRLDATGLEWEPGEVRAFAGTYDPDSGELNLTPGSIPYPVVSTDNDFLINELPTYESFNGWVDDDRISVEGPPWSPEISLNTAAGEELYRYTYSGISFYEMKSSPKGMATGSPERHLSYKWELRNPDSNWGNYDPRSGIIDGGRIMDDFTDSGPDPAAGYDPSGLEFFEYPGAVDSYNEAFFAGSTSDLLGYNDDGSIENNIPLFEIPRQEYLSLGALHMAEFPSGVRSHLGASSSSIAPTASINDVFDRFFLSTVPQGSTTWNVAVAEPLPNSRMEPVVGTTLSDLNDPSEAPYSAEHLYLKGAFNVNSTSVEAWTALLKGIRLETWVFDDPDDEFLPSGPLGELEVTDENQFLRFSQTAEETWRGTYDATDDLEASRELIRKGLRSFTDAEIGTLATEIVEAIRTRRQAASGTVGPFVSLHDFIDSGVLETAITESNLNSTIAVGGTPLEYASSYLTQQDILSSIAPYLTVRSDTFVIRAYGDAVNPFDDSEVVARAYCEAIVQRVHEKHDSESPVSQADPMIATDNTAGALGRNYQIIAFRWLTGDEI